jgi:BirA family biotin operon repressor/biotin-[acetyl-CoA-carboxylase] ligase
MSTIANDGISIDAIRRALGIDTMWRHLHVFDEVASTNTTLDHLARAGAPAGTVVLADGQSQGRMRAGREWYSPRGVNLYVSALLREPLTPSEIPVFALIASVAVSDAVKDLGLTPAIKWPNDVLVDRQKVAGALLECAMSGNVLDFLIIGVGVNVNIELADLRAALGPSGLAATSLAAQLKHRIDRNQFAASYLTCLDARIRQFRAEGAAPVLASWRDRDVLTGRRVEVRGRHNSFEGRALGVDDKGQMLVKPLIGPPRAVVDEEIRVAD